jgi:hypothetical protein
MNVHRFLFRLVSAGLMFSVCLGSGASHAQTILIDDFNDCNDDGWTRDQIGAVGTWDPGFMHEPDSSCAYRLAAEEEGSGTLVGAAWDGAEDPVFSNGFFRATVRAETPETAFLMAIRNQNPPVFGDAYVLLVNLRKQSMSLEKVVGFGTLAQTDLEMNPNEDWYIEIGAVGDQLSAKAWPVGDPEPAPQLTVTDPTFETGGLTIGAGIENGDPVGIGGAVFDDLTFTVPEPSTSFLAGVGLLGVLALGRLRQDNSGPTNTKT